MICDPVPTPMTMPTTASMNPQRTESPNERRSTRNSSRGIDVTVILLSRRFHYYSSSRCSGDWFLGANGHCPATVNGRTAVSVHDDVDVRGQGTGRRRSRRRVMRMLDVESHVGKPRAVE